MGLILNGSYGGELLTTLVNLYKGHSTPDFVQMSQCLIFLDDPLAVADVLEKLSNSSDADALMAYQIAFDMYESAPQQFLSRVLAAVRRTAPIPITEKEEEKPKEESSEAMETDDKPEEKEKKEAPAPVLDTKEAQLKALVELLDWLSRATNWDKLSATATLVQQTEVTYPRVKEFRAWFPLPHCLPRDQSVISQFFCPMSLLKCGDIEANPGPPM